MKEEKLKYLKQILDTLDKRELTVLGDYLTAFDSRSKGYKPKTLILFQLFQKYDDIADVYRLFKKKMPSEDAMRMTIYRLKEKIGESLLLDINISHEESYDELSRVRVDVAKKKLVALIYASRGLRAETIDMYNKVIELSKKYELYNDLVEVLYLKQRAIGLTQGKKEFEKLDKDIEHYEVCRAAFQRAGKIYHEIILNYGFKGLSHSGADKAYQAELENKLEQLKADYKATKSGQVGYYYNLLMIEYNQITDNIGKASKYCQRLVETVQDNPSVYHRRRLGIAYLNYCQNELFNFAFDSSLEKAHEAIPCFKDNSPNQSVAKEMEFYGHFYKGDMHQAEQVIAELLNNEKLEQSGFRYAKWSYLLACVNFINGVYNKTLLNLQDAHKMDKDREGWNIGIRVLTILYAIENEQHDYADSLIVNLRQFIKEGLKDQAVRERDKNILDILLQLRKTAYNFKETAESKQAELNSLYQEKPQLAWHIQSPELIVFHQWFASKLAGKKYSPEYSKEAIFKLPVVIN